MRKNCMLGASVVAFGLGFLSLAQAQTSDVVVDLSVLDSLSPSSVSEVAAQPLFPVVKKNEEKPVVKKTPVRKKAKTTRKTTKTKPAAKIVPAVKVEVKTEEPQAVVAPAPVVADVVELKDVAPVEVSEPVNEDSVAQPEVATPEIRPVTEDEHIVVVDVEPVSSKSQVVEEQPKADIVEPVVQETVEMPEQVSNSLFFAADVSDLTSAQQQQIDKIIASFENPQQNKIAILAYNLDDGIDTFKRKRLSLNRAVDVRSYLLQKGYKNFSIKVINVASGSDKVNSVEIMEMK